MRLPVRHVRIALVLPTAALVLGGAGAAIAQGMQFGPDLAPDQEVQSGDIPAAADPLAAPDLDRTEPLSGEEAASLIAGNTLDGWRSGSPFTEFYDEDGSVRGTSNNAFYTGNWSLDDDRLCVDYAFGDITDYDACAATVLPREGEFVFQDETGADIQAFELRVGNPDEL